MALINCPECGKEKISDMASACPECGFPIAEYVKKMREQEQKAVEEAERKKREEEERRRREEKERQRKEEEERRKQKEIAEKEARTLHDEFCKAVDWRDLIALNNAVTDDLHKRINTDIGVTYVTYDNLKAGIDKLSSGEFEYPYILICSRVSYPDPLKNRRYMAVTEDGRTFWRYFSEKCVPAKVTPVIEILSTDLAQVNDLLAEAERALSEKTVLNIPDFTDSRFSTQIEYSIKSKSEIDKTPIANGQNLYMAGIACTDFLFPHCFDLSLNALENSSMAKIRMAHLATSLLFYQDPGFKGEFSYYSNLFSKSGILMGAINSIFSKNYSYLKDLVLKGEPITAKSVDSAFSHVSLIYHNLPNDIVNKAPSEEVCAKVDNILKQHKDTYNTLCDELGLPTEELANGYTIHDLSIRSAEGLKFICGCLQKDMNKSIADIVEEYRKMLEEDIARERAEKEAREARRAAEEEYSDGGGGFLRTVAGAYIGGRAARKSDREERRRQNSKYRDLKGSAGCLKAQKSGATCSATCNLYFDCIWGQGHGRY